MTCTALGDGCRQSARQVLELFELPSVCVHARYRVGERVDALYDGNGRLSPQGVRGEESARAVCASRKKPPHARRFFVRQIHEGPHWGSRQSTQYQSSPGTDRRPSHLT